MTFFFHSWNNYFGPSLFFPYNYLRCRPKCFTQALDFNGLISWWTNWKQENDGLNVFYIARVRYNKTKNWTTLLIFDGIRVKEFLRRIVSGDWQHPDRKPSLESSVTGVPPIFINVWARRKMHSALSEFPSQYPW